MTETFVVGFLATEPEGITPIDVVSEITGLSNEEIKQKYEIVEVPEREIPDLEDDDEIHWSVHDYPEKDPEDLLP
jgi:S-adenosylmethionine/arginine decarboxylase-like enzyme